MDVVFGSTGTKAMTAQTSLRLCAGFLQVVLLFAAACSPEADSASRSPKSPSPSGVSPSITTQRPGSIANPYTRTCESGVYGDLGPDWRSNKDAVVVGPIAFLYPGSYRDAPAQLFARHGTGYSSHKVLAVIEQGSVVTVAVAPSAIRIASLLYDPSRFRSFDETTGFEVSEGEEAVKFEGCPPGGAPIGPPTSPTQFPGGFIVAGPQCVPLSFWVGDSPTPTRRVLSFGSGDCSSV